MRMSNAEVPAKARTLAEDLEGMGNEIMSLLRILQKRCIPIEKFGDSWVEVTRERRPE